MSEIVPPVPKVYAAINAVQAAMSREGIAKDRKNAQQGYSFRGIDDCYAAVGPHLAAQRLCVLPRVIDRQVLETTTKAGGALFYTVLKVEFDFVSVEDGSKHTVCLIGEAMDSGDKSSNKAQSAALKYCFLQVFCIPTEGDNDADSTTHEAAGKQAAAPTKPAAEKAKALPEPRANVVLATADQLRIFAQFSAEPTGKRFVDKVLANVSVKTPAQLETGYADQSIKWIQEKLNAAADIATKAAAEKVANG